MSIFFSIPAALGMIHPYQNEDEPKDIHRLVVRCVDAANAKHVCQKLQEGRGNNHPTVALPMDHRLGNVGAESDAEENDKEICGGKTRAKRPLGRVRVFESCRPGSSVVVIRRGGGEGNEDKKLTLAPRHGSFSTRPGLRRIYSLAREGECKSRTVLVER